jgi:hypothetical protein
VGLLQDLQPHHHLNHDTAEQSSSHQNIDSYIYQSRPIELNTRKYRDYSDRTWLNSLNLSCCFGVGERALRRAGRCAGQLGSDRSANSRGLLGSACS